MIPPIKPFSTYKWRWLSVQPSEGLLVAPVFLGVLRALKNHEGEKYSSELLFQNLQTVREETNTTIDLARSPERNLFRNSGQYWRGTGLIVPNNTGIIELTRLGDRVANGELTNDEFVTLMIRNTVLPNPLTYQKHEIENWENAGLRIKPFELILTIIFKLGEKEGDSEAYLTTNELIKIIIPLAGAKKSISTIVNALISYRSEELDISNFPDCAPGSNDKRLAMEFLLFLSNFGVISLLSNETRGRYDKKFKINDFSLNLIENFDNEQSFFENALLIDNELSELEDSDIPLFIERQRRSVNMITRSGQRAFRREVMRASEHKCLLTQETTREVVEAAHIIPVAYGGSDSVDNGLCMRVDIHRLFDSGKIRISHTGEVVVASEIANSVSYRNLPSSILFPPLVNTAHVEWRWNYL